MEHSGTRRSRTIIIIALIILICVCALFAWTGKARKDSFEEQAESIRNTVRERALQCYVIEGAYPESLDYLIENYGLAVNLDDYKIVYMTFAENLPPEVKVISKKDN